jgi:tetratricopeptide (TPR) repeat protein
LCRVQNLKGPLQGSTVASNCRLRSGLERGLDMTIRAFAVSILAGCMLSANLLAIWVRSEISEVPVERLIFNLEQQIKQDPTDVSHLINLARLYSMAYALKVDTFPAAPLSKTQIAVPYFPPGGTQIPRIVRPAKTPEHAERAARRLKEAIRHYEAALAVSPDNMTARIGYAWVLEQAGEKARAIDEYRRLIILAWPREQKMKAFDVTERSFTQEAASYLIPLLDPVKDAAEIKDLTAKQDEMKARPRAVTPIAVPLADGLPPAATIDRLAKVRFDADGSGLDREWTWISRDAAWLVYDAGGRGEIKSALQLFGGVTFWLFWSNGYDAMRALDDNGDGELANGELQDLALWHDRNANGSSEPGEVRPLSAYGIVALSCDYIEGDGSRFAALSSHGVRFASGRTRPTYDVILRHSQSTLTKR